MSMQQREPWMIQVDFHDQSLTTCPVHVFRRELKGTGIEVDTSYMPAHVGRGRFVGRGFMTLKAAKKLTNRVYVYASHADSGRQRIHIFKELKFDDAIASSDDGGVSITQFQAW